jgi:hypothetical protein
MKKSVCLILSLVYLCGGLKASAQQAEKKGAGETASNARGAEAGKMRDERSARFETLRREGFDALYNLDYDTARARFKQMQREFPDHPAGFQYLADTLLLQTLNEQRRLQTSLYSSDSFYSASEEKADPQLVKEFNELTRQAKLLAEARLKKDKRDAEALFFLGSEEALRAAFAASVEHSFMTALRAGSAAVDIHRETLKIDPSKVDAALTVGLYDYIAGSLPFPVKMLAAIGGVHGSRRRGIETVERVAREGLNARDDAKAMLLILYKREERYADAVRVARELAAAYPRNYLFKLETASALVQLAQTEKAKDAQTAAAHEKEAFMIFDALLSRDAKQNQAARSSARALDLIHFSYGSALMIAGEHERAAQEFTAAAKTPNAQTQLVTMAHLNAARALDLAGKRSEAIAQYNIVLSRANVYNAHEEAKRGLKEPYVKKPTEDE